MGPPLPKTLLVILVCDHAATLRAVALNGLAEGFSVLVVDDGSTDDGLDTVADLRVARHRFPSNRGKGAAILAAAELAKRSGYDAIVTIDARGSTTRRTPAASWKPQLLPGRPSRSGPVA